MGFVFNIFFYIDKAIFMFMKSVNSIKLEDIANSLNIGIRTKINKMKLNRNNRNGYARVEISSDTRQNIQSAVQIKTSEFLFNTNSRTGIIMYWGKKTTFRFKQTQSQMPISPLNCYDPSLCLIKWAYSLIKWMSVNKITHVEHV